MIELALTLPMLLVIVMGIFDFGLMFQRYTSRDERRPRGRSRRRPTGYPAGTTSLDAIDRPNPVPVVRRRDDVRGIAYRFDCGHDLGTPPTTVKQLTVEVDCRP